jgi:hypothetical protein
MRSGRMARRLVATAGMGAIIAVGVLSACAREKAPAPEPSTVTKTVTETAAPTEKSINPTGGNLFTPPVKAPGPPTPAPGNEPGNK